MEIITCQAETRQLDEEPAEKKRKPNPCVVCLGTLQDAYMMPR